MSEYEGEFMYELQSFTKISSICNSLGYSFSCFFHYCDQVALMNLYNTSRYKQKNRVLKRHGFDSCHSRSLRFFLTGLKCEWLLKRAVRTVVSVLHGISRVNASKRTTARALCTNDVDKSASVKSTFFQYVHFYNHSGVSGSLFELWLSFPCSDTWVIMKLSLQFMLHQRSGMAIIMVKRDTVSCL